MAYVRFDELTTSQTRPARAFEFVDPAAGGCATSLDEVLPALQAATAASQRGLWVALALSYEAAPAFDKALQVRPRSRHAFPLLWWQAFTQRQIATPLPTEQTFPLQSLDTTALNVYPAAVETARERIRQGDIYQTNLTVALTGQLNHIPTGHSAAWDLYTQLAQGQQSDYCAFFDTGNWQLASASPELFFQLRQGKISCQPMKGTAPRGADPAADQANREALLNSRKEQAENLMIVDLLRNDLSRVCLPASVAVTKLFTAEAYPTLWQLTSTITGHIRPDTKVDTIFRALFPCGSVTGAPKVSAMATIVALENTVREVYCGALGYLCPSEPGAVPDMCFSVPIRTAICQGNKLHYGTGAGITWDSVGTAETAELATKAKILSRLTPPTNQNQTNTQPQLNVIQVNTKSPAENLTSPTVPVANCAELSSTPWALLETFGIGNNGVNHLHLHLSRLAASAQALNIDLPLPEIAAYLAALPGHAATAVGRLTVPAKGKWEVTISTPLPQHHPVRLALDPQLHRTSEAVHRHKTTARHCLSSAEFAAPHADEVILRGEDGLVVETTRSNLLYRQADRWHAPPLTKDGLPGIGIQALAKQLDICWRPTTLDDLYASEEIRVVNSLRGWRAAELV